MIVQEPVQASSAAIWHCLNHYDYSDAIFLSERLYAEVKTDESLFLLATSYYRNGQKKHAYHTLKDRTGSSSQCRYLLGSCAYDLEKYAEAESALIESDISSSLDDIAAEYGEQASFVLLLLGKIAAKTERKTRASQAWKKALKLNPFLWSSFEHLCNIGERLNPYAVFEVNSLENMSMCHGSSINNIESLIINTTPNQEVSEAYFTTPQQILNKFNPNLNKNTTNSKLCTPDESPLANPLTLSGIMPTAPKTLRIRKELSYLSPRPSFGQLFDGASENSGGDGQSLTPNLFSLQTLTESNSHHHTSSLAKRMRAQVDNLIGRKEASLFQNCKPNVFSHQSGNVAKTPTIPLAVQPGQNVRRSSRLFSNNYSVKENNKSPNRNKFATPKSPSRKTKQRIAKCNLNKNPTYTELNTRNKMEKEKSETITSAETKTEKSSNAVGAETYAHQAIAIQKQSAEGLMCLLRELGGAYQSLARFQSKEAVEQLTALPANQFDTAWVLCLAGRAHFEQTDYEASARFFGEVHAREPHRLDGMDVYSTCLWHLQREVALSALAQELLAVDKGDPVAWCASGNCFSLHKEHDTAIKFFQRAVQVDPNFAYAYTLLGHEYITTEELDKAMSCFRNAVRLNPRHYNAWFGIGTIYSKQERYHLAELNFKRALSISPLNSVILCHIGVVQHAMSWTEKALCTFNFALNFNSKSLLCKFHRASTYHALGRHSEALHELEELKELIPKESLVYYLIGKVHKKLGNTDLALMHFSWATDLDPKGASSQIKEAFDPSIGRGVATAANDAEDVVNDSRDDSNTSEQPRERLNFTGPDDSDDSY
ncbi:unnamed protein product [Brassicogethes aeneus]|uniref:Cell division cycle protein 27 homolog n=1 Tax=Brassicogethes aeneus TaxID=1431903 RepID=A0A9P0AS29_BRAAE|nr:unnamed protein product [Brassicogethes aeneus]